MIDFTAICSEFRQITHISARRWFDGCNTYHSVRIFWSDLTEDTVPFAYGHGDQWRETAQEAIGREFTDRERAGAIQFDCVDVKRRGYLHDGGRS